MKFRISLLFAAALINPGMVALLSMTSAVQAADMADNTRESAAGTGFSDRERQLVEKYFGKMPVDAKTGAMLDAGGGNTDGNGDNVGQDEHGGKDKHPSAALAKDDALPPGLTPRYLPADLEEQLPPPPAGYERQIIGDSTVVLVDKATGRVADIISDILIPGADD